MATEQIAKAMELIASSIQESQKQHGDYMRILLETLDKIINKSETRKQELRLDLKQPLDKLKGTSEEVKTNWACWSEKFEAHIAAKATKGLEMFEWIKKQKEIIDEDKRDEFALEEDLSKDYVNDLSIALHQALVNTVEDEAYGIIRNINKKIQGFESYRRLYKQYDPSDPAANKRMRTQFYHPPQDIPLNNLRQAIESWETLGTKLETRTGERITDEVKIITVATMCPPNLKEHLSLNCASLNTYNEHLNVILTYVDQHTANAREQGAAPYAFQMGTKGKGKEKGKQSEEGKGQRTKVWCRYHQNWVFHREHECTLNPQKGKGKPYWYDNYSWKGKSKGKGKGKGKMNLNEYENNWDEEYEEDEIQPEEEQNMYCMMALTASNDENSYNERGKRTETSTKDTNIPTQRKQRGTLTVGALRMLNTTLIRKYHEVQRINKQATTEEREQVDETIQRLKESTENLEHPRFRADIRAGHSIRDAKKRQKNRERANDHRINQTAMQFNSTSARLEETKKRDIREIEDRERRHERGEEPRYPKTYRSEEDLCWRTFSNQSIAKRKYNEQQSIIRKERDHDRCKHRNQKRREKKRSERRDEDATNDDPQLMMALSSHQSEQEDMHDDNLDQYHKDYTHETWPTPNNYDEIDHYVHGPWQLVRRKSYGKQPTGARSWQHDPHEGQYIELIVDSGSSAHGLPLNFAVDYPTDTSKPPMTFISASKDEITSEGMKYPIMQFQNSKSRKIGFQVMDISKPLLSVSKLRENGYRVVFDVEGSEGSYIQDTRNPEDWWQVQQRNGVFSLKAWITPHGNSARHLGFLQSFQRQE